MLEWISMLRIRSVGARFIASACPRHHTRLRAGASNRAPANRLTPGGTGALTLAGLRRLSLPGGDDADPLVPEGEGDEGHPDQQDEQDAGEENIGPDAGELAPKAP